jgi:hypothetical protein
MSSLERKRFSILTKDLTRCYICGLPKQDIHEIYEGAKRIASMKHGCCLPVCRTHHILLHNDRSFALKYKEMCQKEFEKNSTRENFIKIFKRSYL